jgi:hypothetical protein
MAYDDEMPQPPTELPLGWKPGDMLPPEEGSDDAPPGLLARADREGRLAPQGQPASRQEAMQTNSASLAQSGEGSADHAADSSAPGLHVDPYFQSTIDNMRQKSPTFNSMLMRLENSSNAYTVHPAEKQWEIPAGTPCDYFGGGCRTSIDPIKVTQLKYPIDPTERTEESGPLSQMTIERALAHEFGHQVIHEKEHGWERVDSPESDAVDIENQVMR